MQPFPFSSVCYSTCSSLRIYSSGHSHSYILCSSARICRTGNSTEFHHSSFVPFAWLLSDFQMLQSVATTDSSVFEEKMRLSIGKLSNETGVNIETIRYYERIDLMPPPFRSEGGHRIYDETHRERLTFIRRCRDLGFPLEDIRELLAMADKDDHCSTMRPTAYAHLDLVRAKITALQEMEKALNTILEDCQDCATPSCSVSNALFGCAVSSCPCAGTCDISPAHEIDNHVR